MSARLDWSDAVEVSLWIDGLRASFADLDATASDMLRAPRKRELGPALHSRNYEAARSQILQALDYANASPEPDDGEPSDPAGFPH